MPGFVAGWISTVSPGHKVFTGSIGFVSGIENTQPGTPVRERFRQAG